MPLVQRVQLKCNHCQKLGHVKNQCYIKNKNFPRGQNQKRPPQKINMTEEIIPGEVEYDPDHSEQFEKEVF